MVTFIGHRKIYHRDLREKLYNAVEREIIGGCKEFIMGSHGDFDKEALSVCQELRQKYGDIKIKVVITSFAQIKPIVIYDKVFGKEVYRPFDDVETTMFEIEEVHFKRKIIESNRRMIDECDRLICYVDSAYKGRSGALDIYNYAKKKGLHIVNLYE